MFRQDKFDEHLEKLRRRSNQAELQIEMDLLDLFELLGFNKTTARCQVTNIGSSGRRDIVLSLDQKTSVVVEVKRPGNFKREKERNKAITQAADYLLCKPQQSFGIATDGVNWIYFKVKPFGSFYRAHRILGFNIKSHPKVAQVVLRRSQAGTLKSFLKLLAAVHQDITSQDFDVIMNLSLSARVDFLSAKARDEGVKVSGDDELVLRELYKGGRLPVQLHGFLLNDEVTEPVKLTKSQRRHSIKPKGRK